MKNIKKDESGIAHLYLAILIVVVLAGVGFGVMRVISANTSNSEEVSQKANDDELDKLTSESNKSVDAEFDGTDDVEDDQDEE